MIPLISRPTVGLPLCCSTLTIEPVSFPMVMLNLALTSSPEIFPVTINPWFGPKIIWGIKLVGYSVAPFTGKIRAEKEYIKPVCHRIHRKILLRRQLGAAHLAPCYLWTPAIAAKFAAAGWFTAFGAYRLLAYIAIKHLRAAALASISATIFCPRRL